MIRPILIEVLENCSNLQTKQTEINRDKFLTEEERYELLGSIVPEKWAMPECFDLQVCPRCDHRCVFVNRISRKGKIPDYL